MNKKVLLSELIENVLKEMEIMNYSVNTKTSYKNFYKRVLTFANENDIKYFSEKFRKDFLLSEYNCKIYYSDKPLPKKFKSPIRMIKVLSDYQLHGIILPRVIKRKGYIKPKQFEKVLIAYEKECENNEYSLRGMRTRLQRLYFFIDYLNTVNVKDVNEIDGKIISDYIKTIYGNHEKSINSIITTLRVFLKFLYSNNFISKDISLLVPKQNKYYYPPIPSVWKKDDVKKMLTSVDRGNPTGKRDYAILILVTRLGIRVGDIITLELSDLNFNEKIICIEQSKNKKVTMYPILQDIGWALIDYLKNARPISDSPYVFLRMNAPYQAFGKNANLHYIITKYTRKAKIKIPKGNRKGMHSLRHTLAGALLEQGTSLNMIANVLGHMNMKSTAVYLNIGFEDLRKCALELDEVTK